MLLCCRCSRISNALSAGLIVSLMLAASPAFAVFTTLVAPSGDATIFEDAIDANGGGSPGVCIGNQTTLTSTRRGFAVYPTPSIPTGSTVTRVVLNLQQERVRQLGAGTPMTATLQVRRVTGGAWTEGTGVSGGGGGPCGVGQLVAGIDWASAPVTSGTVSASEFLPVTSTTAIVADTNVGTDDDVLISDVQSWVDGTSNDGWMLRVSEESTANNARWMTLGNLQVDYTVLNGVGCSTDNQCTSGHCVAPSGLDCGGGAGCVCCNVATCTTAGDSCVVPGSEGTCQAAPTAVPSAGLPARMILLALALAVAAVGLRQFRRERPAI